ncbi:BLUF domain-containing protein [Mucilaginibacter sp. AW1-3]
MLHQVIYTSYLKNNFNECDFFSQLMLSRQSNTENNITGMLFYASGKYLQLIEGPKNSVTQLMGNIHQDERHYDIEILTDTPINYRNFANRPMEYRLFADNELEQMIGFDDIKHNTLAAPRIIKMLKLFGNAAPGTTVIAMEQQSEFRITA